MADLIFNTLVPPPYASNSTVSPQSQSFSILPPVYSLAEEETIPQIRPSPNQSTTHLLQSNRLRTLPNRLDQLQLDGNQNQDQLQSQQQLQQDVNCHSSSSKRLTNIFSKKSIELTMSLSDNLIFVYPNQSPSMEENNDGSDESTNEAGKQPHVIVNLTLNVPINAIVPPNGIESIQVELMANESLGFPDGPFEYNTLRYLKKQIEDVNSTFKNIKPGQTYTFQTILDIPHDVTPYECSRFGRVLPRIRAHLKWSKTASSTKQKTKLFLLNQFKDLKAEQDVWIVSVPRTSNILDYARTHQSAVNGLGPIVLHVRTQHLTVGGYMRVGLSLPAPSKDIEIEKIQLFIIQHTTLISRGRDKQIKECQPERHAFMNIEGEELRKCIELNEIQGRDSIKSLIGNWIARIPSDRKLRPSTLQGSKDASIRVSHQLELRITFNQFGNKQRTTNFEQVPSTIYSANWPFTLASCACKWRSLKLPVYSESEPLSQEAMIAAVHDWQFRFGGGPLQIAKKRHADVDDSFCSCGIKLDELLSYECEQDNAQQASTIGLMNQEIQAATINRRQQSNTVNNSSSSSSSTRSRSDSSERRSLTPSERYRLKIEEKARQEYQSI